MGKRLKSVEDIAGGECVDDLGCQYAYAFGTIGCAVWLFYNYELNEADSLEDLRERFRNMFDEFMEK